MTADPTGPVLYDLLTLSAYDAMNDLSPSEVATLNRDLGKDWQQNLMSAITQPMTLRSGTVLVGGRKEQKGSGCPVAVRFVARVVIVTFVTMMLMAALHPFVNPALVAGNQAWAAAKVFAGQAWALSKSCPVGTHVDVWQNVLCGGYSQILKELQYNTFATVQKLTELFRNMGLGAGALTISLNGIYAFVRGLVRTGDSLVLGSLDVVCALLLGTIAVATRSRAKASTTIDLSRLTPDQVQVLQDLLAKAARDFKKTQHGGRCKSRVSRRK